MTTPQQFYDRALAAADADGRLPLPEQSMWEIFPFEPETLTVKPLEPLTLPEPPRRGEGGDGCWRCANPEEGAAWCNERWALVPVRESRLPIAARVTRAVESLDVVGRVHLNKYGDGGAHLHAFLAARPAGMLQLRGSCLWLWEEMLPTLPPDEVAGMVETAVAALADLGEVRV